MKICENLKKDFALPFYQKVKVMGKEETYQMLLEQLLHAEVRVWLALASQAENQRRKILLKKRDYKKRLLDEFVISNFR